MEKSWWLRLTWICFCMLHCFVLSLQIRLGGMGSLSQGDEAVTVILHSPINFVPRFGNLRLGSSVTYFWWRCYMGGGGGSWGQYTLVFFMVPQKIPPNKQKLNTTTTTATTAIVVKSVNRHIALYCAGVPQDHHHRAPETSATVWLSAHHHRQWSVVPFCLNFFTFHYIQRSI